MTSLRTGHLLLCCLFALAKTATGATFNQPDMDRYESGDGTVQLSWKEELDRVYEVRRSTDPGFADSLPVYEGPDTATIVTGLREGTYYFRIRARHRGEDDYGDWSDPALVVTVRYIDRRLVTILMSAGLVTFLAIVGTIYTGHRRTDSPH